MAKRRLGQGRSFGRNIINALREFIDHIEAGKPVTQAFIHKDGAGNYTRIVVEAPLGKRKPKAD